jgi:hypothetical protein
MSEFAFFRFMSSNMLNLEEQQHKDEIVSFTEEVLDANGIECDSKISKIYEERLREIFEQVRKLRKKKKIEEVKKDNYKKNKIFLYNNTIMSRTSPSATPLWPFICGPGIVAFIYFLTVRAGIAIFLIFKIVGVTMIMFWVYHNARTKQNSDIKFIAKPVHLQSRKSKSLTRTEMRLLYSRYRRNHQKLIS